MVISALSHREIACNLKGDGLFACSIFVKMGVKAVFACVIVLVILFRESVSRPQPICPSEEEVAPCSCKNVAYGLHVVCKNLKSSALLKATLSRLAHLDVGNLLLHGLHLEQPVPENLFEGMTINALQVEDSKIIFEGPAFMGLESSLGELSVARRSETGLDNFRLARLSKLTSLLFNRNGLVTIEESWLKNSIPNVQKVNFDYNEITSVNGAAFVSMEHLKELSIADNRLQTLSRSMLPRPATYLMRMDFSHNELRSLPTDMFNEMPNLETVVFSGNEIQILPEGTWSVIWDSVQAIFLYENALVCDEHIDWIKERRKPRVLVGSCAAPENMAGRPLKDALVT